MNLPLSLTVAAVAECTLQDSVQCHEADMFKQLKGHVVSGITLPLVLHKTRNQTMKSEQEI